MLKKVLRIAPLVTFIGLVIGFALIWWQQEAVYDWWRLRNYDPPSQIVQLADRTDMTERGRRIFYAQHPELNDRESFNRNCTDNDEKSVILGCYIQNTGIFIYNVNDARLNGVQEVTAAHEMLHAAYVRLSKQERARIDELVQAAYDTVTDERIRRDVEAYRTNDPSIVPTELHSIIGTEIRTIPDELEAHYRVYFTDRQKVVTYYEQYVSAFNELRNTADQYTAQITALKTRIDTSNAALVTESEELTKELAAIEDARNAPNLDINAFNRRVNTYNQRVRDYNRKVKDLASIIDEHNALIEKLQSVIVQEQDLYRAIDSSVKQIETR